MLYVSKGAVISDLNVRNGGVAIFSSGATLQGTQNFGGTILLSGSVDASAAQVSLDISERKTSADIIISNLTLLNTTNYSITVSEMQSKGLYKLASGASAFEGTITICTTNGVCYDPISIGDTLTANAINRTFTLVESAGILYVSAGIMPGKVNIYYNDELVIANNAVSGITLNNDPDNAAALMNITSGGSAVATQVKTGGIMRVSSSGRATSTTLQNGGIMRLSSGAQGYNTLVNYGGSAHASSGAVLSKTVINSGGKAFAEKTAEISDVTVSGGGTLYVSSGSILQGSVYIAGALNISGSVDATGADLVLDLTSRKNSAGAMISSLDDLNIANFTVTISSTPEAGSYLLAENASNYTGSITVGDGNLDFGTLTIGGETFNYRYATYGLSVDQNGALSLDIVSQEPAVFVYSDETLVSAGPELNDIKLTAGRLNSMCISSGGVANNTIVSGGILDIFGGMANSTTLFNRGAMNVFSGGMANSTTINFRGTLNVSGGIVNRTTVLSSGGINILKDGVANQTLLESKGYLKLTGGTASATTIGNDGNMHIYAGTAVDTTIQNGDLNVSGGSVKNTVVGDNGYMQLLGGVTHTGTLQIAQSGMVVAATQATVEFTVAGRTTSDDYLINDLSKIIGTPNYTILVADDQALGTYKLAQGAGAFTGSISVSTSTTSLFDLEVNGEDILRDGVNWSLDQVDGALTLTVNTLLTGDKNGTYFSRIQDTVRSVELSADDFASALLITPVSKAVDAYGMPAGSWKWQACTENTCQEISSFVSDNTTEPQVLVSDADGDTDVFFANAVSTWRSGYAAEHQGTLNGWTGTEEQVLLEGKNKIADVFTGSNDANVLVLTDGTNGDALFVDDIYTAFGKDAARLSEINEIRAGAGNDIVDLTSQRYSLAGTGVKVFGGSGDDTIWANSGSNTLFGDAGNDRIVGASGNDFIIGGSGDDSMLGGGGEDTFFFGSNWGNDTIEQLSGGKVTLHFENGSESNWNAETLTYSDGTNSVTVSGVEEVTLVFGEDASVAGAFLDAASEKIFEDKNKGMIA